MHYSNQVSQIPVTDFVWISSLITDRMLNVNVPNVSQPILTSILLHIGTERYFWWFFRKLERYKIKDRGQLKEFKQIFLLPSLGLTRNRSNDLQRDFFHDCSRRHMAASEAEKIFIHSGDFQFQVLASRWRDAFTAAAYSWGAILNQ